MNFLPLEINLVTKITQCNMQIFFRFNLRKILGQQMNFLKDKYYLKEIKLKKKIKQIWLAIERTGKKKKV